MGSYSQLSKTCRECIFINTCDHKRMEAVAYMDNSNLMLGNTTTPGLL
jgi:hypothetical protein